MKKISRRQWIGFGIWATLYVLFCIWMENLWLLLGLFVLADIFLTRFVPWGAWKRSKNKHVREALEWVDDILFALIAVYFINLFVFQNYQIPTASLEKTLLVGDYLFVSKLSYGPRVPNTPLSFPLVQNTMPFFNCKSYLDWPHWGYKRVKGLGHVQRNDIVVFNLPTGDTVALLQQNPDYYWLTQENGYDVVNTRRDIFGKIVYRPVDKRENYVKRCVGLPGDTLMLRNNKLYINGRLQKDPVCMQLCYFVETNGTLLTEEQFRKMNISREDRRLVSAGQHNEDLYYYEALAYLGFTTNADGRYNPVYRLPLTAEALAYLRKLPFVRTIKVEPAELGGATYPPGYVTGWTRDDFGPIWIPRKGATIDLNERNLALYRRCIVNYEGNHMERRPDGTYADFIASRRTAVGYPPHQRTASHDLHLQVRLLLDDGRQPPQQRRQSLVGLCAGGSHHRQTHPHLALHRQGSQPLQRRHPMEPHVPTRPLGLTRLVYASP